MDPGKDGSLIMDTIVKTYRYFDDDEINARKRKRQGRRSEMKRLASIVFVLGLTRVAAEARRPGKVCC